MSMFVMDAMIYQRWLIFKKIIAILSAKGATFRCLEMGISKNEVLEKSNNSVTYDKGVL